MCWARHTGHAVPFPKLFSHCPSARVHPPIAPSTPAVWIHWETVPYRHLFMVNEVTAGAFGYQLDRPGVDIAVMAVLGTALRLLAFGGLAWVAWRASKGTR